MPPNPGTILIADDEPNIRRVFEAVFSKEGHTVLTAENGKRALDLALEITRQIEQNKPADWNPT